ncbi:MAG TPA: hypothetical protein VNQ79_14775 [Blastocatellia bacterium]|nr:hypothetical protein [Blastocatellia bacterium]
MATLLSLHSIIRWIVVIAALVAAVALALTWLGNKQNSRTDRVAMSVFTGLLDTQALIGIVLLAWMSSAGGAFPRYRMEHAATMIIAVIVAHLSALWRRSVSVVRARNNLFLVIIVLLLIWAGVQRLPKGWTF